MPAKPDISEQLAKDYKAMSLRECAKKHGRSIQGIRDILNKNDVEIRPPHKRKKQRTTP